MQKKFDMAVFFLNLLRRKFRARTYSHELRLFNRVKLSQRILLLCAKLIVKTVSIKWERPSVLVQLQLSNTVLLIKADLMQKNGDFIKKN